MKAYKISEVFFTQEDLVLVVNDLQYTFKIADISKKLASADEKDRNNFRISPSGYGIHWPGLDEDLSINGLFNSLKKGHVA